ncbi:MAG: hypothetical protein AB2L21_08780 [Anaerolineaceae bacterium]
MHNKTRGEIEARILALREELETLDEVLLSEHTIRDIPSSSFLTPLLIMAVGAYLSASDHG